MNITYITHDVIGMTARVWQVKIYTLLGENWITQCWL